MDVNGLYTSALLHARVYRLIIRLFMFLGLLPVLGVTAALARLLGRGTYTFWDLPLYFHLTFGVLVLGTAAGLATLHILVSRQLRAAVEVNDDGFWHRAPGKPRYIGWEDVMGLKLHRAGRQPPTLRLKTAQGSYTFDPLLVPDRDDRPQVVFRVSGLKWRLPSGEIVPATLQQSAAYQIVKSYRPELVKEMEGKWSSH